MIKSMPSKKIVAKRLENYREALGKNETDFAVFIGTTPQNYNHIKTARSYPGYKTLFTLIKCGFNVNQLF